MYKYFQMIVGFCGYARSGKDTCANIILNNSDIRVSKMKLGFADSLRDFAYELNVFFPELNKSYREILQEYGYEKSKEMFPCIRKHLVSIGNGARLNISPKIWVSSVKHKIRENPAGLHLITDVRYPNEVEFILSNGGIVIYIYRPGISPANEVEERSIQEILLKYQIYQIENDDIRNLEKKLLNILYKK